MSRIGRLPIPVPAGVDVNTAQSAITVRGPRGEMSQILPASIRVVRENGTLLVERDSDEPNVRALHGLMRSLLANMVTGVTTGYEKRLEIVGVGYRVVPRGPTALEFSLGYSHQITFNAPEGVTFTVEAPTRFSVQGIDKQAVGEVAANIRKLRKPEPYKGKGIRYAGEQIRRKVGKAGK